MRRPIGKMLLGCDSTAQEGRTVGGMVPRATSSSARIGPSGTNLPLAAPYPRSAPRIAQRTHRPCQYREFA
eukprot:1367314-Rhodomonas_salina.3